MAVIYTHGRMKARDLVGLMKRLDIRVNELAAVTGLTTCTISNARYKTISYGSAKIICDYLGMTIEQVFEPLK